MTPWNHQANSDHLRRRAEYHLSKSRPRSQPSAAATGHKRVMTDARSTEIRDGLNCSPYLSDMSGATGLKK